ncbi:NlpC/P60 family protein [Rahnella selenatireducens]|uniref:NlpC/P60 family protein n=1 Tax=Rahnella selenatireducens TaxID=3389797 RepID=UPI00396921CB
MFRIKNLVSALLFIASFVFSMNSFAFELPKEFTSFGKKNYSHEELFKLKDNVPLSDKKGNPDDIKSALLSQYSHWKGTHYHLGGTTRHGVDCSALMQHLFKDSLHHPLPRTTLEQIKNGKQVNKNNLQPGDLVFFKTNSAERHVGVYVGDNQFIHASKIEGVTISSLDNRYWVDHYETARRLELMS